MNIYDFSVHYALVGNKALSLPLSTHGRSISKLKDLCSAPWLIARSTGLSFRPLRRRGRSYCYILFILTNCLTPSFQQPVFPNPFSFLIISLLLQCCKRDHAGPLLLPLRSQSSHSVYRIFLSVCVLAGTNYLYVCSQCVLPLQNYMTIYA